MSKSRTYKSNRLSNVLLVLEFSPFLELSGNNLPYDFQREIMSNFPYLREEFGQDISLSLSSIDPRLNQKEIKTWIFTSKDRNKRIKINGKNFIYEVKSYNNFKEFYDEFHFLINKFREFYPIDLFNVGLRYINKINLKGHPKTGSEYINKDLIQTIQSCSENEILTRAMNIIEVKKDTFDCRFQYGLFNVDYPSKIIEKDFVLDYDCRSYDDISITELKTTVTKYNLFITDWFERSIGDKLRKDMEK